MAVISPLVVQTTLSALAMQANSQHPINIQLDIASQDVAKQAMRYIHAQSLGSENAQFNVFDGSLFLNAEQVQVRQELLLASNIQGKIDSTAKHDTSPGVGVVGSNEASALPFTCYTNCHTACHSSRAWR